MNHFFKPVFKETKQIDGISRSKNCKAQKEQQKCKKNSLWVCNINAFFHVTLYNIALALCLPNCPSFWSQKYRFLLTQKWSELFPNPTFAHYLFHRPLIGKNKKCTADVCLICLVLLKFNHLFKLLNFLLVIIFAICF